MQRRYRGGGGDGGRGGVVEGGEGGRCAGGEEKDKVGQGGGVGRKGVTLLKEVEEEEK